LQEVSVAADGSNADHSARLGQLQTDLVHQITGLDLKTQELGASLQLVKATECAERDKLETRVNSRLEQSLRRHAIIVSSSLLFHSSLTTTTAFFHCCYYYYYYYYYYYSTRLCFSSSLCHYVCVSVCLSVCKNISKSYERMLMILSRKNALFWGRIRFLSWIVQDHFP